MTKFSDKIIRSFDLETALYKKIETVYSDPATVATIIETGIKVYNMFKRKKSGTTQEVKYLREIYGEIRDMRNDINLIIDLLYDLKVYMDARQVEYIANVLSSKINTTNLFLIGWLENRSGNLEQQFAEMHETKNLLAIYGFAHIHVYMLALQKELDLCYWLKKKRNFVETLLEESKLYFTDALNPNHKLETPAKRLLHLENELALLRDKLPTKTFTEDVQSVIKAPAGCWVDGWKLTRHTLQIEGSIENGFIFSLSEVILKKQDYYREDCRKNGQHVRLLEKSLFEVNLSAPGLDSIIQKYKNGHELYLHYSKSKLELTATLNTVKKMTTIIDTWFDS